MSSTKWIAPAIIRCSTTFIRLAVHAQIIREHQINWYFFLKSRTPHIDGEFKDYVLATFFGLSESEREQVFKTLRTVRIHIVDPRPYAARMEDALRRHLPKGTTVPSFRKRLDESTRHLEEARRVALELIAQNILRDSPAERLKSLYEAWERASGPEYSIEEDLSVYAGGVEKPNAEPRRFDLTPFAHRNANLLNDIANFVSASSSVFRPALDAFEEASGESFFYSPMVGPWVVHSTLCRSHAFDEGHSHAVRWIEAQRSDIFARVQQSPHSYQSYLPEPLQELMSTESVPMQAADVAATIAREVWYRNSLPHLTKRFEYVTFNGERLSEARAEVYESTFRAAGYLPRSIPARQNNPAGIVARGAVLPTRDSSDAETHHR